ncbi:MAG TPA: VOC family protein [Stellaceae bacterium]|nr:VOC family protein [Stellaceae bacterium]
MPSQLPPPGAVFLDHVAHFVPAMDVAAAVLERCGFRLTPFTAQANRVDGALVLTGTGNRCAMLRQGYLELLTATPTVAGDTDLARQLRERIANHVGLHLAAFGSADAAAEHRRLTVTGFSTLPLVEMRRPVTTEAGSDDARFTIARTAPESMAEGRIQFLTHHTQRLVWRGGFLDHPNGAQALTGLWIAAADPAEPAARISRFTGCPARRAGAVTTITLDRGTLHIARPEFLAETLAITPAGTLPCFVAAQIAVASLAGLAAHLDAAGLPYRRMRLKEGEAIAVTLPAAIGDTMLFHAA